ncbi:Riboflavin kinase, partial [Ophiophagus hannah]
MHETHIIHTFNEDFYGEILSIIIVGYIRPEQNFDSLASSSSSPPPPPPPHHQQQQQQQQPPLLLWEASNPAGLVEPHASDPLNKASLTSLPDNAQAWILVSLEGKSLRQHPGILQECLFKCSFHLNLMPGGHREEIDLS